MRKAMKLHKNKCIPLHAIFVLVGIGSEVGEPKANDAEGGPE